jgi:3-deoxy-D-manno-octulosonic-acid transferase
VFSLFLYNISIQFYWFSVYCASFFNAKAKLWIDGRKNWGCGLTQIKPTDGKRVWIHCASLGEFEQARPVIENLKAQSSSSKVEIIITFFSSSGYEIRKNYEGADLVVYLPLDTKANAQKFIECIKPDVVLFVKYEFWFHSLNVLKKQNVPVILFSSVFRENQIFFHWYGRLFREMLGMFSKIFVQNTESKELLERISIKSEVAFDTRFDRVHQVANAHKSFPAIEKFKGSSKILVAGSTWKHDEELIIDCINQGVLKEYKYIIAPHNIDHNRIDEITSSIKTRTIRFSELNEKNAAEYDVVIIDSIGQLASIYSYGEIAYIGGGFNASVHNILEAAVYGIPVLFGPNFKKSLEAKQLLSYPVNDFNSFKNALLKLEIENERIATGQKGKKFIEDRLGGTERIVEEVNHYLKD